MSTETINIRLKLFKTNTGKSIARIALESNLNQDNLYKWIKGTKISDPEDYKKLESYLESQGFKFKENDYLVLENSPTLLNDPHLKVTSKDDALLEKMKKLSGRYGENSVAETTTNVSGQILSDLVSSNKVLSNAMADFAIANKNLSENAVRLTKMAETNFGGAQEIQEAAGSIRGKVLELLSELHSGPAKQYKSYGAAHAAMNKLLNEIEIRNEKIYNSSLKDK